MDAIIVTLSMEMKVQLAVKLHSPENSIKCTIIMYNGNLKERANVKCCPMHSEMPASNVMICLKFIP